jgi:DNA primase
MALDDLKALIKSTPISQIIGQYISVEKKGTNFVAVCPFHDDHDPSMQINDNRGMFMCFVDQLGGDAIKFVTEYRKCNYIEALKDICDKMGWNWDDYQEQKKVNPRKQMAKRLMKSSNFIYQKTANAENCEVFKGFLKNRNVSPENGKKYELGYSPKHNVFLNFLESIKDPKEKKEAFATAFEIGLIKQNQQGQYYDTFRERIMFPIWDQYGNVTAYTSRATKEYQKAKYMNSKDSFMFNKKNILYGLHLAKDKIRERDRVVLVEGNMDQLTLHINGFEETVAIMGVALGETSANVLTSFTHNFYLCLDNDQAGLKAAERVHDLIIKKGIIGKYVDLSPYKDPDDFINGLGKIAFEQRLQDAKLMIDLQIDLLMPEELPEVVDRKIEILQNAYKVLAPLKMDLRATERIVALSKKLGLETSKDQILSSYQDFLAGVPKETSVPALSQNLAPQPPPPMDESQYIQELIPPGMHEDFEPSEPEEEVNSAHLKLIEICILNPEVFEWDEMQEILEIIDQNRVKELVLELKNFYFEFDEQSYNTAIEKLVSNVPSDGRPPSQTELQIREHVGVSLFKKESSHTPKIEKQELSKLLNSLKEEQLKNQKKNLRVAHKNAREHAEAETLLQKIIDIDRELQDLKKDKHKFLSQ